MAPPKVIQRARHYNQTFLGDGNRPLASAAQVLADLKHFCYGARPPLAVSAQTGAVDPIATGVAIGRQEVWLRIVAALNLDEHEIMALRQSFDPEGTE